MSTTCDIVAERVALGEPLGDAADHASSCSRCRRLAALPTELGAIHREVDPGLGFSARMTAGAQHRIGVRRRRRVAAGLAAAVAATSLGVFAVTREPEQSLSPAGSQQHEPVAHRDRDEGGEEDLGALMHFAKADGHFHADWGSIRKPLLPYRAVLQGVAHE